MRIRTVADRIEERFVRPLDVDRICALVAPAMEEVERPEKPAFARLEEELRPYQEKPSGVGRDVPIWLRRMEQEVGRVWATRSALAALAEDFARVPRRIISQAELEEQLQNWEEPRPQALPGNPPEQPPLE
jgi:hypothetical protein